MKEKPSQTRQVYYLVAVDDDYKPVHTTRICSDIMEAKHLRDMMAQNDHDVLICAEVTG
jgi:hypothetical protein